jgi:hypothetical protein
LFVFAAPFSAFGDLIVPIFTKSVRQWISVPPRNKIQYGAIIFQFSTNVQSRHKSGDSNSVSNSLVKVCTLASAVADNGVAAWRSGGFHKPSSGLQTFNSAQPFPRGYCRRCAKPHVSRWHLVETFLPSSISKMVFDVCQGLAPIFVMLSSRDLVTHTYP